MASSTFTQESLEQLRRTVDLVELLREYLQLKSVGSAYKALCPFHEEKTPSFIVQKGDSHYHCFGCGAHGDAIAFLMQHSGLSFRQAVELLARRFSILLDYEKQEDRESQDSLTSLKRALQEAHQFYQFCLLHTPEGEQALSYLYDRGYGFSFVKKFALGLSLSSSSPFFRYMRNHSFSEESLEKVGLYKRDQKGKLHEFFSGRILFPIENGTRELCGFSGRSFHKESFGGKYINSPETPLFKKSHLLYGMPYARKKILREKRAFLVEGQLDALSMIDAGWENTLSALGTSFGENHVREIGRLGVTEVILGFDNDRAGQEAMRKVGDLFQKEGVAVFILSLAKGEDPDSCLCSRGREGLQRAVDGKHSYLSFLVELLSEKYSIDTPSGKQQLIGEISSQIQSWKWAVMRHESLRCLARLMGVPEETVLSPEHATPSLSQVSTQSVGSIHRKVERGGEELEADFLRWILLGRDEFPHFFPRAMQKIAPHHLSFPPYREIYALSLQLEREGEEAHFIQVATKVESAETRLVFSRLVEKKIDWSRAEELFEKTLIALLDCFFLRERESIRQKLAQSHLGEEEKRQLIGQFDQLVARQRELHDTVNSSEGSL